MIFTLYNILSLYNNKIKRINIQENIHKYISKICPAIHSDYIKDKLNDKHNKLLFYSINNNLTKYSIYNEIVGCLLYRIILQTKYKKRIYIQLIGCHPKVSGNGYGRVFLNEFIQKHKQENQELEIVLLSLQSSKKFYKSLGYIENNSLYIERNEKIDGNIILTKTY